MTENNKITGRFEWNEDGSLFFYPDAPDTNLTGTWNGNSNWQPVSVSGGIMVFDKTPSKGKFILSAIIELKLSVFLDQLINLIPKTLTRTE
jgi:hypothetical protein